MLSNPQMHRPVSRQFPQITESSVAGGLYRSKYGHEECQKLLDRKEYEILHCLDSACVQAAHFVWGSFVFHFRAAEDII